MSSLLSFLGVLIVYFVCTVFATIRRFKCKLYLPIKKTIFILVKDMQQQMILGNLFFFFFNDLPFSSRSATIEGIKTRMNGQEICFEFH